MSSQIVHRLENKLELEKPKRSWTDEGNNTVKQTQQKKMPYVLQELVGGSLKPRPGRRSPSCKEKTVLSKEKAAAKVLRQVIAGCVLKI